MELYTVGHSVHPGEYFLGLLRMHRIEILADVRTFPGSRFHPQYNRKRLEAALGEAGIEYHWLGERLGGRPGDPRFYPEGKRITPGYRFPRPDFGLMMQQDWFRQGIDELLAIAASGRTAILCSEEDPERCHRKLLIAAYLAGHSPDVRVVHIRGNGRLEEN